MKMLEKSKKLRIILQYVPVLIALLYALYFWQKGLTEPALIFGLMGIGLILLGVLLQTVRKFIGNDRYFLTISSVLLILMGLYCSMGRGIPYTGIFGALIGASLICNMVLKRKWKDISGVAIFVLAVAALISGEVKETIQEKTPTVGQAAEMQQEIVDKASEPNENQSGESSVSSSPGQSMTDIMNRILTPEQRENPTFQKMMKVMESDSFQKQIQEQDLRTPQEFIDLMAAHGLTEFSDIDFDKVMADAYAMASQGYEAANPGKDPKDEDEAMAKRIGEMLKTADPVYGIVEVMRDPEIALWVAARFKRDQAAFSEWFMPVMKGSESAGSASLFPAPTDFEFPDGFLSDIPSDEPVEQTPVVEPEPSLSDSIPTSVWEEFAIPDAENRSTPTLTIEPEKGLTELSPEPPALPTEEELETALRERFSLERFERAITTLERYGPEEGLRRLREADPEIAEQVERHHSREDEDTNSR